MTASTELGEGVPEADKALMLAGGYSRYVSATATPGDTEKSFTSSTITSRAWRSSTAMSRQQC